MISPQEQSRALSISDKLYELLLYLYPPEFRSVFAIDMVRTFRDCSREAISQTGLSGLFWLWMSNLFDLLKTAFEQHFLESHEMNKSSQQATLVGGILSGLGILFLLSQFSDFSLITMTWIIAGLGALTTLFYLRDRTQGWLATTAYILWSIAGLLTLINLSENTSMQTIIIGNGLIRTDDLIAPYIISAITLPLWVSYLRNKRQNMLNAAYTMTAVLVSLSVAMFTSGDIIPAVFMYLIAAPLFYRYKTAEKTQFLLPAYMLTAIGTSYLLGYILEDLMKVNDGFNYGIGGGLIVSGIGLQLLRKEIQKVNPRALFQTVVMGGLMVLLGVLPLLQLDWEPSTQAVYLMLAGAGLLAGIGYLFDRTQGWLGTTSYILFAITGIVYLATADERASGDFGLLIATFVLSSIALPMYVGYFRDNSKTGRLIAAYVLSTIIGLLMILFFDLFDGSFIAPYIMFAIALPFAYVFVRNQVRWALMPAYIMSVLGIAIFAGILVESNYDSENAVMFTVSILLIVAGLGFQALRPLLEEPQMETVIAE